MIMNATNKIILTAMILILAACREEYMLPFTGPAKGYLVVEGFINSGTGPTTINLSRTLALVDTVNILPERQAQVEVEGTDNSHFTLNETAPGTYSVPQLTIQSSQFYRVRIKTKNGSEYLSDFEPVLATPPVDSITWLRDNGVELYVNTHDPLNNTHYYRWEFEETWEFHSTFSTVLKYVIDPSTNKVDTVEDRPPEETSKLYYCWQSEKSKKILIGSSAALTTDRIYLPIQRVPESDWKISVLYSILVKQYAIGGKEFEFLRRMKKNTEQVGSLFDAQPSELTGNIHNVANPDETVVGYIGISASQEKRLFIQRSELPGWNYSFYCEQWEIPLDKDTLEENRVFIPTTIANYNQDTGLPISIFITNPVCADCTIRGTNIKPSFWP